LQTHCRQIDIQELSTYLFLLRLLLDTKWLAVSFKPAIPRNDAHGTEYVTCIFDCVRGPLLVDSVTP
jgi:hypothetical protein